MKISGIPEKAGEKVVTENPFDMAPFSLPVRSRDKTSKRLPSSGNSIFIITISYLENFWVFTGN